MVDLCLPAAKMQVLSGRIVASGEGTAIGQNCRLELNYSHQLSPWKMDCAKMEKGMARVSVKEYLSVD